MTCTEKEWKDLKHKELYGMVAELFKRIDKLEKDAEKHRQDLQAHKL